ncbi:MAG: hypothetical protein OEN56_01505 [Gemmatimonadota bacterium]|nr:hypothetical protein [Gemmatimonadota bacterium]
MNREEGGAPSRPVAPPASARFRTCLLGFISALTCLGCEAASPSLQLLGAQEAIAPADFAALVERISEEGGYFDTDNLISNESGYLNVVDALGRLGLEGGAYIGVGPDQNFSYIAELRPDLAFIVDVRRDNLLHHLLLKALIERASTRVEFLSALHGVRAPTEPAAWVGESIDGIVAYVDSAWAARSAGPEGTAYIAALEDSLTAEIRLLDVPLSPDDMDTIRRFHGSFVRSGPGLRFTSHGRPPRPYYPTYRQLLLETDADGDAASYLSSRDRYAVVRDLQLANRIIPVVGDLSGSHALPEMASVLEEMGLRLTAFYASNVEFYLWQARTFERWVDNLRAFSTAADAVVIRSYFPNFGRPHPSAIQGYYATQTLQPVSVLADGRFASYWEVVIRGVVPLR